MLETHLITAPLMDSDGTFNLGGAPSRPTGAPRSIALFLFSSLSLSLSLARHSPCRSRWTCGWSAPPRGCGRSLPCRRLALGWGGHWTGEGDSPGWRRPAEEEEQHSVTQRNPFLSTSIRLMDGGGLDRAPCLLPTIHSSMCECVHVTL